MLKSNIEASLRDSELVGIVCLMNDPEVVLGTVLTETELVIDTVREESLVDMSDTVVVLESVEETWRVVEADEVVVLNDIATCESVLQVIDGGSAVVGIGMVWELVIEDAIAGKLVLTTAEEDSVVAITGSEVELKLEPVVSVMAELLLLVTA